MTHAKMAMGMLLAALLLAGCGNSSAPSVIPGAAVPTQTFRICPGPDAQKQAIIAFFEAREGDIIEFCEGKFDFDTGLVMFGKKGITIRGAGKDKTYLRFKNSVDQDGFNLNRMTGITVEGLTIYDAPGNGLRVFRSEDVVIRDVRIGWTISDPHADSVYGPGTYNPDPQSWSANGAYAFYPVICHRVLIEDSISVGSSDAGVYVGQSSDILVRRTEAFHNVAGFEFENTYRAEFIDNYAHDNVAGFLVFDLPGRVQFGEKNLVHRNRSYNNNIPQFAPRGAIVSYVPSGTGALVLASDQLEFYDNDIKDNNTVGLVIVNYGLVDPNQPQNRYDFYPEGMHIYSNTFTNNGTSPQVPDPERSTCTGPGGLPGPGDDPACLADNAGLLVTIIQLKNGGKSAQIIWDGAVDGPNDCTQVPVDRYGIPLNQPNPNETREERYEARMDERGRPNLYQYDPEPVCKYNAWKFNADGTLKKPQNGMCIENNVFNKTTPQALLVDDYANIKFGTPDPTDPANLQPVDHTIPTECPIVEPALLPQFVPVLPRYVPNPANDPRPSDAELARVCASVQPGQINHAALSRYNCPRLDQYNLFADPEDPTRNPNGFAVPFDLNTILFSDYALKYRFVFFPPDAAGRPQKATYMDHTDCETLNIYDCYTATLGFPVGTVFAKTFAFKDGDREDIVETRLLIKRQNADGRPVWVGLAYEWKQGADGRRYAELKIEGSTRSVRWDYADPDPEAVDAQGQRLHYRGATDHYAIPSAAACLLCHGGDDREAGAAPIGPKVRNLNRNYDYPGVGSMNQLAYLQAQGYLDLPAGRTPEQLEKMVRWNVPGSGGDTPGSAVDVHKRARAFLEVNCMHCHNPAGGAQNSGLRLDAFTEPMGQAHGICKPPIAAGRGADAGDYDIQPGDAGVSILVNRVASTAPGIKMPPLARSVMQTEAVNLLSEWIDQYVGMFADPQANTCGRNASPLPVPLMAPLPPTPAQTAPWG
ncbi:parallel beta-helix repeat-containing protein [Fontimonas thermophila]|uniref:Parallel beta-helix repeat-containing protein n=1 Tax=Fontimonas thermophila TaxID=1076937 RepID=A0A1I2HCG0_9GAMM|nr:parallel beta-helix domain-containing protein [Fontimonas thermophila]SFF27238.1 parallel beta-helix repeat-containing protein [Fontimonas thermophila]